MNTQNLQKNLTLTAIGLLILGLGVAGGVWWAKRSSSMASAVTESAKSERKVLYWYDPMKPDAKFDKPGPSPFMDMQLVARYADEGAADTGALTISTRASQSLGMRLATVTQQDLSSTVEVAGTLQLSERDVSIVQARTSGFVERVYARAPGDVVPAGSPLADVLNPDWVGAQQEFLAVKAMGDAALTQAARQRLTLLGMPPTLIQRVNDSNRTLPVTTITAPTAGVLSELMVRQGMSLSPGMTLARITGLGTVWLELALPQAQASNLEIGQVVEARLTAAPETVLKGRVASVLAETNSDTRTLRVRVELPNPGQKLRAGMLATATLYGSSESVLLVPSDAVIRTGKRALVYLAEEGGQFKPVDVQIGAEHDGQLVIRQGLSAGQKVVASGQFLLDSEASMRGIATQSSPPAESMAAPAASMDKGAVFETSGVIEELDASNIKLRHQAVPALKWPAMTMGFKRAKDLQSSGFKVGDTVQFQFKATGDEYEVVTLKGAKP
ncbi:MAG: efflux transporter periplasmic adaptor subunit [Curvibacter sp. RIFCSPHIGHO2_12_FULL_63_18]|jgi:Cu(I)/Ag(I) efflux system membrane fusion protein|uniref:efflux RND transporter periplasmic adaptor subunit n=1 Tax=Rhodoferax sp. TaxID=50421 RepID=UPI0008BC846B|nr:efflux RND transporter periplasmic adaptor subunit [Rhodoferax sp.]MBX9816731.1 efflux RND transporter periplasmic adaptor subunit [Burkholderiaceae bacterium]OGO96835.1 MAG: efflux transporter periplasmic adaptor subunit [Curvibacter sp. GWA2_63_95]OGP01014.1 MAG: efflux transporter periplasmic adaptor subunit [Curvibacter sp. RIFCSPHIGHO2_12_FULL_63_18]HCX80593.1 efflux RND transporter periplasmic adaptor subunit [Rhodoferax sp.]